MPVTLPRSTIYRTPTRTDKHHRQDQEEEEETGEGQMQNNQGCSVMLVHVASEPSKFGEDTQSAFWRSLW